MKISNQTCSVDGVQKSIIKNEPPNMWIYLQGGKSFGQLLIYSLIFMTAILMTQLDGFMGMVGTMSLFIAVGFFIFKKKHVRKYSADTDIAFCVADITDTVSTQAAWGKTLSKMALAGVATSSYQKRSGFISGAAGAAALMIDNSPTTVSKRDIKIQVYFMDGVVLDGKCDEKTVQWLMGAALFNDQASFDRYKRMYADAKRVSKELDDELNRLQVLYKEAEHHSREGADFATRDKAELERLNLLMKLRRVEIISRHINQKSFEDRAKIKRAS